LRFQFFQLHFNSCLAFGEFGTFAAAFLGHASQISAFGEKQTVSFLLVAKIKSNKNYLWFPVIIKKENLQLTNVDREYSAT